MKQWFANDFYALGDSAMYTEANYTAPITDSVALVLHAGYSWGDFWEDNLEEQFDYAAQVNWTVGHFTVFGKVTGPAIHAGK